MEHTILEKYADLLVNYCTSVQEGERLYIESTFAAEPLVREVYKSCLIAGGIPYVNMNFQGQSSLLNKYGNETQLKAFSPLYTQAMEQYEAYIHIRAPYNISEGAAWDTAKLKQRSAAGKKWRDIYFDRTATLDLKRNLCQYPTAAAAQVAGMSMADYSEFIFSACKLYDDDPIASWQNVSRTQQHIVDYLNGCSEIRYKTEQTDISFSTEGRTWINSDGQTNMPSGEVYTSPVEDSVNGQIYFSYPSYHNGNEVRDVLLEVENGLIVNWSASSGKEYLDYIFSLEGTRRFGEAAIGTNYGIDRITKNILFDEKTGGTIHMAIGQSYRQCGGQNTSSVHWDMITEMRNEGEIYADGKKVYEKGKFLI